VASPGVIVSRPRSLGGVNKPKKTKTMKVTLSATNPTLIVPYYRHEKFVTEDADERIIVGDIEIEFDIDSTGRMTIKALPCDNCYLLFTQTVKVVDELYDGAHSTRTIPFIVVKITQFDTAICVERSNVKYIDYDKNGVAAVEYCITCCEYLADKNLLIVNIKEE